MTISAILEAHFGGTHEIAARFRRLHFESSPVPVQVSWDEFESREPTETDHQEQYDNDLTTARHIISAALDVWDVVKPSAVVRPAAPLVQVNNNNTATANSNSNATAVVEFPLQDLLALVENAGALPADVKEQAKDHLEDLDGELRKATPRWEKIKPALKFLLDLGKEISIKTLAAVVAKMATGQ